MKEAAIYIGMVCLVIIVVYGIGRIASTAMSDYEVITPVEGVECVVVSRMFNTSVDCWKIK